MAIIIPKVNPKVISAIDEAYDKSRAMWIDWKTTKNDNLANEIGDYLVILIKHISKFYKKIGMGTSRTVFKIDNSHVLKVGIGIADIEVDIIKSDDKPMPPFQRGGAQNGVERRARDAVDNKYIAGVIAHDPKMKWIVAKYAKSFTSADEFTQSAGISWWTVINILDDLKQASEAEVKNLMKKYKTQFSNPWLAGFIRILPKLGPSAKDDMTELYQWGYVEGKGAVLVDYGYNSKIGKKYY